MLERNSRTLEEPHVFPKMAMSVEQLKKLSAEEVFKSIEVRHGLLEKDLFKKEIKNESKFSKEVVSRMILFRLEGYGWNIIEDYLIDFFAEHKGGIYDNPDVDLAKSSEVKFAVYASSKVKSLVIHNIKDFPTRITTLFEVFNHDRNLKKVVSALQYEFFKKTGQTISLEEMFKKLPYYTYINQKVTFYEICKRMLRKIRKEDFQRQGNDIENISASQISHFFTEKFRNVFFR